ncbi:MAG: hypothetical protein IJZ44_00015 [Lachnospiraceae bacterium]|nr:hypothetical protein [Lachnospiraceae bacterium]
MRLKYGKYLISGSDDVDGCDKITILKGQQDYEVSRAGGCVSTSAPLEIVNDILYEQRCFDPNILALHGAAVAYNGLSYLFLGATTSGKTTLTGYLASKGFKYITDDCILLDRETFCVYPYTTPLHFRQGGVDVLRKCGALPEKLQLLEEPSFTRYVYTPDDCISKSLPLGRIFFLTRTEGVEDENRVEEMTTTERMTELLKSPIIEYSINGAYLQLIARLAKFPCHRLTYHDMNYVEEVIRNE